MLTYFFTYYHTNYHVNDQFLKLFLSRFIHRSIAFSKSVSTLSNVSIIFEKLNSIVLLLISEMSDCSIKTHGLEKLKT